MPKGKQAGVKVDILLIFLLLLGGGKNLDGRRAVGWNGASLSRGTRAGETWPEETSAGPGWEQDEP